MPRTSKIRVLIDSFNRKVLDTVLDISIINKADLISILYPKVEEGKNRAVFIVDTKDSLYKQY